MKTVLATLVTLFFLFTFSTKAPPVGAAAPEPVVDISGQKLKAGASYYILSAIRGRGGGLTFGTVTSYPCPHVVVQELIETSKGMPVQFLPANPKNNIIFTSRNLNIKFTSRTSSTTSCEESKVWRLTKFISEAMHVGTNGASGNQDLTGIFNWFMIEKAQREGVYKIRFCPKEGVITCDDLGIFSVGDDDYKKRFVGLANPSEFENLRVVFQKADNSNDEDDNDADKEHVVMST